MIKEKELSNTGSWIGKLLLVLLCLGTISMSLIAIVKVDNVQDGVQGPQGNPGKTGDKGNQGDQGLPGKDGANGYNWINKYNSNGEAKVLYNLKNGVIYLIGLSDKRNNKETEIFINTIIKISDSRDYIIGFLGSYAVIHYQIINGNGTLTVELTNDASFGIYFISSIWANEKLS